MIRRKYNLLNRATPRTTPWLPWTPSRSPKGSTAADVCALFADASNEIKVMNGMIFICHVTRCQCLTRHSRVPRHNIIGTRVLPLLSLFLFLYGNTRNQIGKQLLTENKSPDRIRRCFQTRGARKRARYPPQSSTSTTRRTIRLVSREF